MGIRFLLTNYIRSPILFRLLIIIFILMIVFGIIMHLLEPQTFPTIFDSIWWVIVTGSTVGYGDYVPVSKAGRVIAMFLILTGAGFISFYMVTLSTATINTINALNEGSATVKDQNHLLFIGWNERVKNTIHQLLEMNPKQSIVIIDQTLNKNPIKHDHVFFVKGDPTQDQSLKAANAAKAEVVLITGDQYKSEKDADMCSVLTLLAIKGINPTIYSIIEILTPEQVKNAKRAGADELIETYKLSSYVMLNSILNHGLSDTLLSILDQLKGSHLSYLPVPETFVNRTFQECVEQLLQEGILVIGIKRKEESYVNPSLSFVVDVNDQLLIIKH